MSFLRDKTPHDLKYVQDLIDESSKYVAQLVLNVFNGVVENLGLSPRDKDLIKPPGTLQKGFLNTLARLGLKLNGYLGRRLKQSPYAKFKIKGLELYKDGKPLTHSQWQKFESQLLKYMQPYLSNLSEEMAVKGIMLGLASLEMEEQGKGVKEFGKKSYKQIESDRFKGYVPDSLQSVEDRYKTSKDVTEALKLAYVKSADFVTQVTDNVRSAIKSQVIAAHRTSKSKRELASDLYWMNKEKPELNGVTAEKIIRDYQRVSNYELASLHETGKMAALEGEAKESIKDPDKAVYVVFNGAATCDWCGPRVGTIARVIPVELVGNERDDSLSSRGIKDNVTDIAVWQGKNNIGYKKPEWRLATPAHPSCSDTFSRIHPEFQTFDKEQRRIKYKPKNKELEKFIPKDFMEELEAQRAKIRERQEILDKRYTESMIKKDSRMTEEELEQYESDLRKRQQEAEKQLAESRKKKR